MPPEPSSTTSRQATSHRAPRADAQRSITAILDAGEQCLLDDPDASTAQIARAAGLGRVTVYGHFPSRGELVDAIFARVIDRTDATLGQVDIGGDPTDALQRLVSASWRVVSQFRAVLAAAQRTLPPDTIRDHHERHQERWSGLLTRGRRSGDFRDDLPGDWLVAVCMALMHTAADEVRNGRLSEQDADRVVVESVLSAWRV